MKVQRTGWVSGGRSACRRSLRRYAYIKATEMMRQINIIHCGRVMMLYWMTISKSNNSCFFPQKTEGWPEPSFRISFFGSFPSSFLQLCYRLASIEAIDTVMPWIVIVCQRCFVWWLRDTYRLYLFIGWGVIKVALEKALLLESIGWFIQCRKYLFRTVGKLLLISSDFQKNSEKTGARIGR